MDSYLLLNDIYMSKMCRLPRVYTHAQAWSRTHVKDPVVHVIVRWITETWIGPACTKKWQNNQPVDCGHKKMCQAQWVHFLWRIALCKNYPLLLLYLWLRIGKSGLLVTLEKMRLYRTDHTTNCSNPKNENSREKYRKQNCILWTDLIFIAIWQIWFKQEIKQRLHLYKGIVQNCKWRLKPGFLMCCHIYYKAQKLCQTAKTQQIGIRSICQQQKSQKCPLAQHAWVFLLPLYPSLNHNIFFF